jgi:uroporphyrin-III C-methyltransferase/precorrin-2 dehydrogenase/sirohydrochlorin ferrochelatase
VNELCKQLTAHGLPATTPAALVEKGTTQQQRVHIGDLGSLPDMVEKEKVQPPTLIIVGEVVKLHDKLAWFEPDGEAPMQYPVSG